MIQREEPPPQGSRNCPAGGAEEAELSHRLTACARELSPRAPPPLCPPLASPSWRGRATPHPPGFIGLALEGGLAFPLLRPLVLRLLCP